MLSQFGPNWVVLLFYTIVLLSVPIYVEGIIPYLKRHHTLFVAKKINLMIISDHFIPITRFFITILYKSALTHLNLPKILNQKIILHASLDVIKTYRQICDTLKKNRKCNILRLCSVLLYLSSCQIMHE